MNGSESSQEKVSITFEQLVKRVELTIFTHTKYSSLSSIESKSSINLLFHL